MHTSIAPKNLDFIVKKKKKKKKKKNIFHHIYLFR